jgi:hypothetical protein
MDGALRQQSTIQYTKPVTTISTFVVNTHTIKQHEYPPLHQELGRVQDQGLLCSGRKGNEQAVSRNSGGITLATIRTCY